MTHFDVPNITETHRQVNGHTVTDVRLRLGNRAQTDRRPGARLIWGSVILLAALAAVAFYVSYAAQFLFVDSIKHDTAASYAEALIPDAGMLICAMLALGMAVAGRQAKAARLFVVLFAAVSAVMNYMAANSHQAHPVSVYVMPPLAFAACTDLVVSTVRRFAYGLDGERSPWSVAASAVLAVLRLAGVIVLYSLRLVLAFRETSRGLRQMVLTAAPLPEIPGPEAVAIDSPPTKKAALLALYRSHPDYGNRAAASRVAAELAPQAGLQPGTARTYLYAELDGRAS